MFRQNWLFFSVVWLLNTVTDANNQILITATLTQDGDLGKCQSCLTDIAGMDRLSLALPPTDDPKSLTTTVHFYASGYSASFMRAKLDCQSDLTCGFITMENTKITDDTIAADMLGLSEAVCVLTDVQTSFECGTCLRMVSGSHTIQKFQLIAKNENEQYLHVLYTDQRDIFAPCSESGVCRGQQYEFRYDTCSNLARKLYMRHFIPFNEATLKPNAPQVPFNVMIPFLYETQHVSTRCFLASTTPKLRTGCLRCMALKSSGIAVLVDDTSFAHEHEITSELYVLLISEEYQNKKEIHGCEQVCNKPSRKIKEACSKASLQAIDYSSPSGKIYYNVALYPKLNQIDPSPLRQPLTSNCIWVQHELSNEVTCQTCLKENAGHSVEKLSEVDFLIYREKNLAMDSIYKCISTFKRSNLCKKMVSAPDQFCLYYKSLRDGSRSSIVPYPENRIGNVGIGMPSKPNSKCFTCLTSILDILIIDQNHFWMLGAPREGDCVSECGDIKMVVRLELDVSSIRPMSSGSIEGRFAKERYSLRYEKMLDNGHLYEYAEML